MLTTFWYSDKNRELGVETFESTESQRTYLSMVCDETVISWSRRWPTFGDRDEQIGYVLPSANIFENIKRSYPELEYYEIIF